jgi:hypothetical protein
MKKKNEFRLFFTIFSITIVASLIIVFLVLIILKYGGTTSQVAHDLVLAYTNTTPTLLSTTNPNTIAVYTPNPRIESTSIPIAIQTFPVPTPTQYIENGWSQKDLAMDGFLIEIPDSWSIQEEIVSTDDVCGLGKGLANYRLRDYGNYQDLFIQFICGARGGEDSYCPPETQILDEERGIARSKIKPNEFQYWHFTRNNNTIQCLDGWKVTDQVVLMAYYKSTAVIDLATADYIVLSVHKK